MISGEMRDAPRTVPRPAETDPMPADSTTAPNALQHDLLQLARSVALPEARAAALPAAPTEQNAADEIDAHLGALWVRTGDA